MIDKQTLYAVKREAGTFLSWKNSKDIHWNWNFADADLICSKDFAEGLAAAQPERVGAVVVTVDVNIQS